MRAVHAGASALHAGESATLAAAQEALARAQAAELELARTKTEHSVTLGRMEATLSDSRELTRRAEEALQEAATQLRSSDHVRSHSRSRRYTDPRLAREPAEFDGYPGQWPHWSFDLLVYYSVRNTKVFIAMTSCLNQDDESSMLLANLDAELAISSQRLYRVIGPILNGRASEVQRNTPRGEGG